ncbi:DNA-binding IclR family transcriptional regulator [Erwinia toletana]|uniref:DNA-binding IclR family transcriptional regulator n=1 Tax=Winslowiella toletana TaxID=92490 RepID=A0ABS4PBS3_9GAMM|nr:IclR family transcriptional regulator [Winslowiella toletana]MBP2170086.1 DNA-binding IclR family transcriptional regulator [Winslowiella toletana]
MTTLENAAAVLKLFTRYGVMQGQSGLSFSDVVESLGLPKSTVSRLLATMESQGLLERDPDTRCFHIGRVLLSVASSYLSTPLVDSASPLMARLATESNATGYISVLDGREIIVMRMFHCRQFIQVVTPAGSRSPAAETSVGRAILARHSDDYICALYQDAWQVSSPNSPQTLDELLAALAQVRQQGWALARNETLQGISSLATAVSNKHRDETIGVCLSFPSTEGEQRYSPLVLAALMTTAHQLAEKFGDLKWLQKYPGRQ